MLCRVPHIDSLTRHTTQTSRPVWRENMKSPRLETSCSMLPRVPWDLRPPAIQEEVIDLSDLGAGALPEGVTWVENPMVPRLLPISSPGWWTRALREGLRAVRTKWNDYGNRSASNSWELAGGKQNISPGDIVK